MNKEVKHIYMIGIGGISMSGIAEILKTWGYEVSGSDRIESNQTKYLEEHGINVYIGQKKENITEDIDLVVYTAAINADNPELVEATRLKIPLMERGVFLGEITKLFPKTIGIAGTHGKTTTTSMVSSAFLAANLDPTIQVGAVLDLLNANYRVGKSPYLIIEACEYKDSFLNFHQESAIVLNIDNDHLDYFKNMDNMMRSYQEYVSKLPENGVLVLNIEDERCKNLANYTKATVVTVGKSNALWTYDNVTYNEEGYPSFDVYYQDKFQKRFSLQVTGEYNILNSLTCIALCSFYGIALDIIQKGLSSFSGASRRMEYKGLFEDAKVYDDYAHHPTEVKKTAEGILKKKFHESWVVFECHSYSRFVTYLKEFAESLSLFDHIILADIYAARETNTIDANEEDLVGLLKENQKDAIHISSYEKIKDYLKERVKKEDVIITMGAGNITKLAEILVKEKEQR